MSRAVAHESEEPMPRPNRVVVMTGQQRPDLCAREGFALDSTPFLDALARE